jgi:hypothetical protein
MNDGDSFGDWLEFVFQTYTGHTREVIYAEGLPDIKDSRPHGERGNGRLCLTYIMTFITNRSFDGDHVSLLHGQSLSMENGLTAI